MGVDKVTLSVWDRGASARSISCEIFMKLLDFLQSTCRQNMGLSCDVLTFYFNEENECNRN